MNCNHEFEKVKRKYLRGDFECINCGLEITAEIMEYVNRLKADNELLRSYAVLSAEYQTYLASKITKGE